MKKEHHPIEILGLRQGQISRRYKGKIRVEEWQHRKLVIERNRSRAMMSNHRGIIEEYYDFPGTCNVNELTQAGLLNSERTDTKLSLI